MRALRTAAKAETTTALEAMTRLFEVGSRCVKVGNGFQACLDDIVNTAIMVTGADSGNLQIFNADAGVLKIAAQQGLAARFLDYFAIVSTDDSTVCAAALAGKARIIAENLSDSPEFKGSPALTLLLADGVRAMHSTPLISSVGTVLGVISVHFRKPHRPSEQELRLIDLLARQSADYLERKQAEEKLRRSEERYRGVFLYASTGIIITDLDGQFQSCNPAFVSMLGYSEDELRTRNSGDVVHPEDRDHNEKLIRQMLAGEINTFEVANRYLAKNGSTLWVHKHGSLLRDGVGRPSHMIVLVTDISERKLHEEHTQLLMREINHRSKNILSLVGAVARQTAATTRDEFVMKFDDRITSLAAAQDLLVRNAWRTVPINELVRTQLSHFADLIGSRIELAGPSLSIKAKSVQTLGMAIHELATNAAKYGALSTASGHVSITWSLRAQGRAGARFSLSWVEQGGPPVQKPQVAGFGSTVTSRMVEHGIGGVVSVDYRPSGLAWRVDCTAAHVLEGRQVKGKSSPRRAISSAGGPRVLVIEDEPLIALEVAKALEAADYQVIGPAANVSQGLALIEQFGCDAAVLDVMLGKETSEPIARNLSRGGTSFVVISGYTREQLPAFFQSAPLVGKPLAGTALVEEVMRCMEPKAVWH